MVIIDFNDDKKEIVEGDVGEKISDTQPSTENNTENGTENVTDPENGGDSNAE